MKYEAESSTVLWITLQTSENHCYKKQLSICVVPETYILLISPAQVSLLF